MNQISGQNLEGLLQEVENVLLEGYAADQILNQIFSLILRKNDIDDIKKARIVEKIALCD